jgi:hypothetical protein
MPIAIRIRQNDAFPTRSGSTNLVPTQGICAPTWGVMRVGLAGKLRLVAGGAVAPISGRGGGAGAVALKRGRGGAAGPNSGRTGAPPPRLTVATVTLGILNAK